MKIHIPALPGRGDHDRVMASWLETFPVPGTYEVTRLESFMKAGTEYDPFERWFFEQLYRSATEGFRDSAEAVWRVLDQLLARRGVSAPSELEYWDLQRALFDVSRATVARMAGLHVATDVAQRLTALGWSAPEILEFPVLAYRMGLIWERLKDTKPAQWNEVLKMARSVPLSSQERGAVDYLRRRAGVWLQPIFDDVGQVWTAERELIPLRRILEPGVSQGRNWKELSQELREAERAQGVFRDVDRVIRTELAEARARGSWAVDSKGWTQETKLFRVTQPHACKGCLRLYRAQDGSPKLYTMAEVLAADALGPNRGSWRDWHVVVGATHPRCVCAPFQEWNPAMRHIFEASKKRYADLIRELGLYQEAA